MTTNAPKSRLISAPLRWASYPLAVCVAAVAVLAAPAPQGDLPSDGELAAAARSIAERQKLVNARVAYKEALVGDLVAGHAGLREVAERFLIANAQAPRNLDLLRLYYKDCSDLECCARSAIDFAKAAARPAERPALDERLACEYAALAGVQ